MACCWELLSLIVINKPALPLIIFSTERNMDKKHKSFESGPKMTVSFTEASGKEYIPNNKSEVSVNFLDLIFLAFFYEGASKSKLYFKIKLSKYMELFIIKMIRNIFKH